MCHFPRVGTIYLPSRYWTEVMELQAPCTQKRLALLENETSIFRVMIDVPLSKVCTIYPPSRYWTEDRKV